MVRLDSRHGRVALDGVLLFLYIVGVSAVFVARELTSGFNMVSTVCLCGGCFIWLYGSRCK